MIGLRRGGPGRHTEPEWVDATHQIVAWRKALAALKEAEERLCKSLAWDTVPEQPYATESNVARRPGAAN